MSNNDSNQPLPKQHGSNRVKVALHRASMMLWLFACAGAYFLGRMQEKLSVEFHCQINTGNGAKNINYQMSGNPLGISKVNGGRRVSESVDQGQRRDETLQISNFQSYFKTTDKTWRHGYQWFYGRHFPKYRGRESLAILEIGGRRGDSAVGWKKYFGNRTRIDIITYGGSGDKLKFENPTIGCKGAGDKMCGLIHTFYCDQSNISQLNREVISARPDGWDIIIDDGSHVPSHSVVTFEALWKHVRPGGIYIVEDVETSYYPKGLQYGYHYNAGILASPPLNVLSRFRQYVDVINRKYLGPTGERYHLFDGDGDIMEIGYARNIIFIKKALTGVDSTGKSYTDYPYNMVKQKTFGEITDTLREALKMYQEQSKILDKYRTGK